MYTFLPPQSSKALLFRKVYNFKKKKNLYHSPTSVLHKKKKKNVKECFFSKMHCTFAKISPFLISPFREVGLQRRGGLWSLYCLKYEVILFQESRVYNKIYLICTILLRVQVRLLAQLFSSSPSAASSSSSSFSRSVFPITWNSFSG